MSTGQPVIRAFSTYDGENMPKDEEMKKFYALGVNLAMQTGSQLKSLLNSEELQAMLDGHNDMLSDKVKNSQGLLSEYGPACNAVLTARADANMNEKKKEGVNFMADFLVKNPNAQRTSSGLIFHETVAGTGKGVEDGASVVVHYHGTFVDGKVFDSSVERGSPLEFQCDKVIAGWAEGIKMMKEGGKATLVIPSDLAYGDNGSPPVIPPASTLVFDVELLEVKA